METFSLAMLPPGDILADVVAAQTPWPRSLSGRWRQHDFTAGGRVVVRYSGVAIGRPAQHLYWLRLARQLNGSAAGIVVPIQSDILDPGPAAGTGITHSDGTTFSDGTGYAQSGVTARLVGDHALNAGTITFSLEGDAEIAGGEWFSIRHPTKHFRAYGIWAIDEVDETGAAPVYTAGIQPPLREAAPGGTELDFTRPRFLAQLAEGTTMPWRLTGAWNGLAPPLTFVERFVI